MYSRNFRKVFNTSKLIVSNKNLINTDYIFINLLVKIKKTLPCLNCHFSVNIKGNEFNSEWKDPTKRKESIDESAQQKIDKLMEDPEIVRRKKVIEMEIMQLKADENIPTTLRPRDWLEILQLSTYNKRKRFLKFLFTVEKMREKDKEERMEQKLLWEETKKSQEPYSFNFEKMEYGIGKNSLLRRVTTTTINKLYNWNNLQACMFGNEIVIDCSFDKYMSIQELRSCARQIMQTYAVNRQHNFPFNITICNINLSSTLMDFLHRYIPQMLEDDFPLTLSEKSYLELFDKNKLVYLTSDSHTEMVKYNHNLVYIIGAYVDKGSKSPVSLAKAKEHKLKTMQLPIDRYLRFGDGSNKCLTINQVCAILLDSQVYDWNKALSNVPRRKLYEYRVKALEAKLQRDILYHKMQQNQSAEEKWTNRSSSGEATSFIKSKVKQ